MGEANTFSIVARCRRTGELGVAVASAVPAVGSMCPFIRSGVGAASTQSWVNPYLALNALGAIESGCDARSALEQALAEDEARELRQIGVVDTAGESAAHTGERCTPWCGHILAPDVAIQGNMLIGPQVLAAMAEAFAASAETNLAERLMAALEAGEAAGGDKRGKQSAALKIHETEAYPSLDIRVDEHAAPVRELRRVLRVARAQLVPFVRGMPRRGAPAGPLPVEVTEMLRRSPPDRPEGGGSRPDVQTGSEANV